MDSFEPASRLPVLCLIKSKNWNNCCHIKNIFNMFATNYSAHDTVFLFVADTALYRR